MAFYREPRPQIEAIGGHRVTYGLNEGQLFYETPKSFEVWQEKPYLRFIKRFSKKRFFLIWERS